MLNTMGKPIKRKNLYEILAEKLEEYIIGNPDMQGKQLPSEQEIADMYGVSRNVVRETFKILKERGLILLKNGEGAFVGFQQDDIITRTVNRMMQFQKINYNDIYNVREPLEIQSCRLAAKSITEEEIDNIRRILKNMYENVQNNRLWAEYDLEFHLAIAKASRNELLYVLLKPLTPSLVVLFQRASSVIYNTAVGLTDHQSIIDALAAGDENRAAEAMRLHLDHSLNNLLDLPKISQES